MCNGPGRAGPPDPAVQITVITVCLQLHNNASINRSSARDPSMLLMLFTHVCSGGARDSMLPGHSQVNYFANQVKRKSKSRNIVYVTVP